MNFIELLTYVRGALGVVLETRWAADMDGAADDQVASVTAHVTDPLLRRHRFAELLQRLIACAVVSMRSLQHVRIVAMSLRNMCGLHTCLTLAETVGR